MDHLKSSEERRARWYSKLQPRFVAVQPAVDWEDVLPSPNEQHDDVKYDDLYQNGVKSVPMHWLLRNDDDNNDTHFLQIVHSKLLKALQYHGFLVISKVISNSECQDALRLAWDWVEAVSCAVKERSSSMEQQTQISELDDASNDNNGNKESSQHNDVDATKFPKSIEGGIIPFYGSSQSSFAWKMRSHPNVIRLFQCLWSDSTDKNDNDNSSTMITSLDGIVLWQSEHPPADAGWFHVDQNPITKPGFECVQGLINLLPVTSATGGNAIVPQSHHVFPLHYTGATTESNSGDASDSHDSPCLQFYQDRLEELNGDDWMEIDPNDTTLLSPNKNNIISCLLGSGDMLLWDSRLVHCSYPGRGPEPNQQEDDTSNNNPSRNNYGLCRAATLVSMMPQSKCSLQVLQQRRRAVDSALTLTHWSNKVAPLGNEHATDNGTREEAEVIAIMKKHQAASANKVLLEFDDLNVTQQGLVVGDLNQRSA